MNINFTGLGVDITSELKDFTNSKFERIIRHFEKITSIDVTFTTEKLNQIAEGKINIKDSVIHATAKAGNIRSAIDELVSKLDRQVRKHKEKITHHR